MDYKRIIDEIRDSNADNVPSVEMWATAIETLLAERDAMIVERNAAVNEMRGLCKHCKHSPPSYRKTVCYDCCEDYHNWQWRGPKEKAGD